MYLLYSSLQLALLAIMLRQLAVHALCSLDSRLLDAQALGKVVNHFAQALSQLHLWLPAKHLDCLQISSYTLKPLHLPCLLVMASF